MKDPQSYAKAKRDWEDVQEVAYRRFHFEKTRRAYLQGQSARITVNINVMERLEYHDALVFGSQRHNEPGRGRWPYA